MNVNSEFDINIISSNPTSIFQFEIHITYGLHWFYTFLEFDIDMILYKTEVFYNRKSISLIEILGNMKDFFKIEPNTRNIILTKVIEKHRANFDRILHASN